MEGRRGFPETWSALQRRLAESQKIGCGCLENELEVRLILVAAVINVPRQHLREK